MKTVKDIYEFFLQYLDTGKNNNLMEFLNTVPEFTIKDENGVGKVDMSLGMEYYQICEKMVDDALLIKVGNPNPAMRLTNVYMSIHSVNAQNPQAFLRNLDYGVYDFKYRGFTYTYNQFKDSMAAVVGTNQKGDADIGTAYYIGDHQFATAAHCVTSMSKFNLLKPDNTPYKIKEVWFATGQDTDDYDLAILVVDETPSCRAFWLGEPAVLDDVLVMGFPPIPGLNTVLTAETASVATRENPLCKAVVGQNVGEANSYLSSMDYFLINARVKGGNSGGPIINNEGRVIGTVVQIPFDNEGGFDGKRFDIMGFGICLPAKYLEGIIANPSITKVHYVNNAYSI